MSQDIRTHFTSLPSVAELNKIIAQEQYRSVPTDKTTTHFVDHQVAIDLLNTYHLPTDYFTKDWTWQQIAENDMITQINAIGNKLLENLLADTTHWPIFDQVYDYLAEDDQPEKSDIIFVFGAKTPARIEKAVELYHQGLAPQMMLSGGNPFYDQQTLSEAEKYRDIAIQKGVDPKNIILETTSITIPDNVGASLNQLKANNISIKSWILVNSPYSQRRGYGVFQKHTESFVKLYRVNCATSVPYSREQWFKNPDGIKVVFNELVKLKFTVIFNTA